MADYTIVEEALKRGYTMDEIADNLARDNGVDPADARGRGYTTGEMMKNLGYVKPETSDVARGFVTSFKQLPQLGYGLLAGAGAVAESVAGEGGVSTSMKNFGVKKYQEAGADIEKDSKQSDSLSYSWEQAKQGDFGSLVDWLQYGIGYGGGQAVQALATAGVGSLVGKTVLKGTAENLASKMVAKEALRLGATEEAKRLTAQEISKIAVANVASNIGQTVAIGSQAFGMEGGEIFGDLAQKTVKEGRAATGGELAKAFGATAAAGALEFVGDKLGVDVMLGKSKMFKPASSMTGVGGRAARAAVAVPGTVLAEGGTEYLQTGIEEYGKGNEKNFLPFMQSESAQKQALDAAGLGAVGGGGMAMVGGAFSSPQKKDAAPSPSPSISSAQTADDAIAAFQDEVASVTPRGSFGNMDELAGLIESERSDLGKRRGLLAQQQQEARDMEAEFSGLVKDEQIDQSYRLNDAQKQRDAERTREGGYDLALQQREEQQGRTVEQLAAASEAQGFGNEEPTAMQLAMQQAQQKALDNEFSGLLKQERASLNEMRANVKRVAGVPVEQISTPQLEEIAQSEAHPNTKMAAVAALNDRHDAIQQERERLMQLREARLERQADQSVQGEQPGAVPDADNQANVKALTENAAKRQATQLTNQGYPTVAYPHPTQSGMWAIGLAEEAKTANLTQNDAPSRPSASWVIRNKETGEVVMETFDRKKVDALNTAKYEAVPILEHLQGLNKGEQKPANERTAIEVKQPIPRKKPSPDNIAHAIINMGGVSTSLKNDILGDAATRTRPGFFTSNGTTDLGALAARLSGEFGFSQINLNDATGNSGAKQLADLIARAVNGESILNEEAMIRAQEAEEVARHQDDINRKAEELGIKPSGRGRPFSKVEAEVLKLMEIRLNKEIEEAGTNLEEARAIALRDLSEEQLAEIQDKAMDALGENPSILETYRALAAGIKEAVNENERNKEAVSEGSRSGIEVAGAGHAEEASRPATSGTAREGQSAEAEVAPEFGLVGQAEEEAIAEEQARRDAEAKRQREEQDAENKRQADADRGDLTPEDVAEAHPVEQENAGNALIKADETERKAQHRPIETIKMTMAEWKSVHKDFKGITDGERQVLRNGKMVPVEIIKDADTPKTDNSKEMIKSLKKIGYQSSSVPNGYRPEIRVTVNEDDKYARFSIVIEHIDGKWKIQEFTIPDFTMEAEVDGMKKLRSDISALNDGKWPATDAANVAEQERKVYDVNEPDAISGDLFPKELQHETLSKNQGKTDHRPRARTDRNLHAATALSVRQAPEIPGLYLATTQLVTVGERSLPVSRVHSNSDAARVFAYLSKYAVEHYDTLVTDKNGAPLAFIGSFKGDVTSTSVYPQTLLMELSRIDGAAHIWSAHNHPSGTPELSLSDERTSDLIGRILAGSGVEYHGLFAMASSDAENVSWSHTDGDSGSVRKGEPAAHRVAIVERQIEDSSRSGDVISNPATAFALVIGVAKETPGVVFTNAQNGIQAFVPFAADDMGMLRKDGRLIRLFNAAARAGAAGAVIAMPNGQVSLDQFANIRGALESIEVKVLDGIRYDTTTGKTESLAELRLSRTNGTAFFNAKSGSIGNPIDAAALESTIASVIAASPSQWGRDTVVTATLFSELPAPIVEKAKAEGYDAHGRNRDGQKLTGATYDGKVYLVQENISSEIEAEETLLHERIHQILHGNAEDENGKALRQSLGRLYSRIGGKDAIVALAKRIGADMSGPLAALPKVAVRNRPAFLVDEFLAHVEGQRAYEKFPQSVVRAIREFYGEFRDWLRSSKFVKIADAVGVNIGTFTQSDLSWTLKKIRQQQAGTGSKAIRFMTAWHGSPHDHDKFDSSKIGTGEGAQAYGYGLYFAGAREVAEWYRNTLSKPKTKATIDGKDFEDIDWLRNSGIEERWFNNWVAHPIASGIEDDMMVGDRINRLAERADQDGNTTKAKAVRKLLKMFNDGKIEAKIEKGRLYQVELAPEPDEYLDWDKPLSEQAKADLLRDVAEQESMPVNYRRKAMHEGRTGEDFYKALSAVLGSDEAASKVLNSYGIRGIRYLDGSSRPSIWKYDVDVFGSSGSLLKQHRVRTKAEADDIVADAEASGRTAKVKQIQQPDDQNYNYVIFNDADVKITAKESRRASNETTPANAGVSVSAPSESVQRIQSVADRFKSQFKGATALDIRVVSTTFDIPARFRPSPFAEGVFHDDAGLVYLVTMNLRNPRGELSENRAWQVLLHESVGHYGLSQMMGDKFAGILKAVKQATHTNGRVDQDSRDTFKPGDKDYATWDAVKLRYPDATDAELAQEVLARMSETDPGSSVLGYAVAVVRQWVRDVARAMGVNVMVSTSELRDLVAKASGYMRRGDNLAEERVPSGLVAASQKAAGLREKDLFGNGSRVQHFDDKRGLFYEAQRYPKGQVLWRVGEVVDGVESWLSSKEFGSLDEAKAAVRRLRISNTAKQKSVEKYGAIPSLWSGEAKRVAKAVIDAGIGVDRFSASTQSASKYVYLESGLKVRMADHSLPGAYDQPDVDYRYGGDIKALVEEIRKAEEGAPTPDNREHGSQALDETRMQERQAVRAEKSGSRAEPTQFDGGAGSTDMLTGFGENGKLGLESRAATVQPQGPIWSAPEMSRTDNIIYTMQDKNIDLKRVQQAIKEAVGEIRDDIDAYLQEELFHGRAAKITEEFLGKEVNPLISLMRASNVSMEELETFLWARHAKERNAQIAKINDDMPDGGSGLTNKQADDIMAGKDVKIGDKTIEGVKPNRKELLSNLAGRVDAITRGNRALLERYSLESADTLNAWDGAYKHYVPLHREDAESHLAGMGTGQGYSVKGSSSKRATGSSRPVENILANLALQRERIITRGEKNRVAQSLYGLAKEMPNADLWEVDVKPTMKTVAFIGGQEQVVDAIDPAFRSKPNVVFARFNGEDRFVVFNEHNERAVRMAEALKNLDADDISHLLGEVSRWTRYFASINTQYNPIFGVTNLVRDVQTGLLNLKSTPIEGKQKELMGNLTHALPAVFKALRADRKGQPTTGTWAQLWEEFQEVGGQTGYRDMFRNSQERAEALQNALDPTWWQKTWWGKAATVGGVLAVPEQAFLDKVGKPLMELLSDYNTMMENGIRLAAYKVALDTGMTQARAASLAKNLTVNFNRKGQAARQVGSLYAFFNASVQGTARMAETLNHGAKPGELLGKAGKQIVYGGLLLGAVQAMLLMAAGFDDEEPPEFVRDRNIIIPTGNGKYVSIPMPLGFHVLPAISRISIEFTAGGFKKPGEHLVHIMDVLLDSFNPIGNAGLSMQTVAPTVLDPIAALTENKDWSGRQIARQDFSKLNPTPGYTRAKDTASSLSRGLAYALNYLSGGGEYGIGIVSPTPDQIDYLLGQLTGGVGRELGKVLTTGETMATGEDLPPHKIPLVGRFYGDTTGQSSEASKFYGTLEKLSEHRGTLDRMKDARDTEAYREYAKEHPEIRFYDRANKVQRELSSLRKLKRTMIERNADRAKVRQIEDRMRTLMTRFNQSVSEQKGDH